MNETGKRKSGIEPNGYQYRHVCPGCGEERVLKTQGVIK
jgi:predicted RNA-binding Zn-ribbon protein involved in translation (DUF1610 family)